MDPGMTGVLRYSFPPAPPPLRRILATCLVKTNVTQASISCHVAVVSAPSCECPEYVLILRSTCLLTYVLSYLLVLSNLDLSYATNMID